jgi:hypothetical protein
MSKRISTREYPGKVKLSVIMWLQKDPLSVKQYLLEALQSSKIQVVSPIDLEMLIVTGNLEISRSGFCSCGMPGDVLPQKVNVLTLTALLSKIC